MELVIVLGSRQDAVVSVWLCCGTGDSTKCWTRCYRECVCELRGDYPLLESMMSCKSKSLNINHWQVHDKC